MSLRDRAIVLAKRVFPANVRNTVVRLQRRFRLQWPPVGTVRFGSFRRLTPISPIFALDRGLPIERYYIEQFLERHADDVRGRAMEMGDDTYLRRFGGSRVSQVDIFSYVESQGATIIGDITQADHIPSDTFDCIVFTQTLQMIYDLQAALRHLHRILKPGGVLLLTSHGISKIGRHIGRDGWGEYWHISTEAAKSLFAETFPGAVVDVRSCGNVLTAMCALHGMASEELTRKELDHADRDFQVIVTVRAVKAGAA